MYTTKQAAEKLGYNDDSYVRRLIEKGKLKARKINKRLYIISQKQIDDFEVNRRLDKAAKSIMRESQAS